ncbi:C-type lectin domain family 4 member E-like isoform X3 [Erpetoichthys calabaricus]|uniref:C-type lectin domain family 4 member E-like isoform X3 n=1 Tax=Erpetoichthys calabaricus TaxID=27687 RepID=UPI00223458D2|nr:C-type lectin domain family 4 member E-like isoform X3 [Erpetoichthys calabaricus]
MESADCTFYTEMDTDALESKGPPSQRTTGAPLKLRCPVRPLYVVGGGSAILWIVVLCLHVTKSSEMAAESQLLRAEQAKVQESCNSSTIESMEAEIEETQNKVSEVSSQMENLQSTVAEMSSQLQNVGAALKEMAPDMSTQMRKLQREVSRLSLQMRILQMGGSDKSFNLHEWEVNVRNETANSNWSDLSGHQYYFSSDRLSWSSARDTCTSMSSYLAVVTTEQEQDFIISKMRERSWVGLSDLEEESVWKWTTGEPVEQRFWESGEPNNEFDEDCGEIKENGKLNDIPCNLRRHFVCEKDDVGAQ